MSENNVITVEKNISDVVFNRIKSYQNTGELYFPENYVPENAIRGAWLIMQETKDIDRCTKESIANSLFDMVVQGLDPVKKQCYFIVYGNKLTLQRSYFGAIAVAKRVKLEIEDIVPDVVYKNDEFEYEKLRGKTIIIKHRQKLENIQKSEITAAYCTIYYKNGIEESTIMTMEQIKQAWKQSGMGVIENNGNLKTGSTHDKFTEEMCKKTVTNRTCKTIINSSNNSDLLIKIAKQNEVENTLIETREEIIQNSNSEIVDIVDEKMIIDEAPDNVSAEVDEGGDPY